MARSEARISVDIWDDDDFLALPPLPQRMFLFLLSQRDLAHTGVLPLRERRWVRKAKGLTIPDIEQDLKALVAARFVLVDEDTGELLIRSFIRRDKVYRQPNVLRAAREHVSQVESLAIRVELLREMRRVADASDVPAGSVDEIAKMIRKLEESIRNPSENPSEKGSANPSEMPPEQVAADRQEFRDSPTMRDNGAIPDHGGGLSDLGDVLAAQNPSRKGSAKGSAKATANPLGERGVVTAVTTDSPSPVPRSPVPPTAGDAARAEPAHNSDDPTAQTIIGEYVDRCRKRPPGQVLAHLGKTIRALLEEGIDPDDVRRGLAAWMTKGLHPSALPAVVNEAMNTPAANRPAPRTGTGAVTVRHIDQITPEQRAARNPFRNAIRATPPPGASA